MPIVTKYYESDNFILTVVYGKITSIDVYNHICLLSSDPRFKNTFSELADLRRVENVEEVTTGGLLWASEKVGASVAQYNSKLVFVADKPVVYGTARQYMGLAQKTRAMIKVVETMEDGLSALGLNKLYNDVIKDSEEMCAFDKPIDYFD